MKVKLKKKKVIKKVEKKTKKSLKVKKEKSLEKELNIYEKNSCIETFLRVKPGLSMKDVIEGMKNFYFDGESIITYNDKISIFYPFKTDFKAFINAETLHKLVLRLPSESFEMKQVNDQIVIKAPGLNVKIPAMMDEEIISRIELVKKGSTDIKWKKIPENFIESIKLCSFAASTTETDTTLSCVKVEDKICVATDSKRIAFSKLNESIDAMFIKASEVRNLASIEPTHYGITKGWLYFKNEKNCFFSMRKIEGGFPDWEHLFDFDGPKVDLPDQLLQGIDLASIFQDDSNTLSITIENNTCSLFVKTDSGKLKYSAPIKYNKEPISFIINPDFLKEMMKFSTQITFTKGLAKLETKTFSVLTALQTDEDDEGKRYRRHKKEK